MKLSNKLKTLTIAAVLTASVCQLAMADEIIVSAAAPTSDDYALSVIWSNLLIKNKSEHNITVVDNGSKGGLRKLGQGKVDVAIIGSPHFKDATQGKGGFKNDPADLVEAYGKMSALFAIQTSGAQYIFKTNTGVKSFYDFTGKDFSIGRPGGNGGRVTKIMLGTHGIDMEAKTGGVYMKYVPALEQMANGSMDGAFVFGGIPHAAIDNASRAMKLNFASPDPKKFDEFKSTISNGEYYILKEIPAETIQTAYDGRVTDAGNQYFWGFPFMFVVNNSMSEDKAYELTKTLWDNLSVVQKASVALSLVSLDGATQALSADLHPGAAKYFKEIGNL